MLQVRSLYVHYNAYIILKNLSFDLHKGEILAVVGPNGSGKSTLIRAILGEIPISGSCLVATGASIASVRQGEPLSYSNVLGSLLEHHPALLAYYQQEDWGDYASEGGHAFEAEASALLKQFGFVLDDLYASIDNFSEGQRQILGIIKLLLSKADLLILDEPTNHLDITMCLRLEEIVLDLADQGKAVIVVSHDRTFVDRIADDTLYLNRGEGSIVEGGYSRVLEHLDSEFQAKIHLGETIQRKIKHLEEESRRKETWAGRKEKEKRGAFDKGFIGKRAAKLAKKSVIAKRRSQEMIQTLKETKPIIEKRINLKMPGYMVPDRTVVIARGLAKRYETHEVLCQIDLEIKTRDRLALIGSNGSGKSTLMNCLLGILPADVGCVELNPYAKWVYIPQDIRSIFEGGILLDYFNDLGIDLSTLRTYLGSAKLKDANSG